MHKESMNSTMDFLSVKPHTDDQLSKELLKVETTEFLSFLYPQKYDNYVPATVHIKHKGTNFQTPEECLPKQFHQLNKISVTMLGNTQWIPKY